MGIVRILIMADTGKIGAITGSIANSFQPEP